MRALPTSEPLLSRSGHPAFESADKWSFTQAVVRYPASRGHHLIPVGDYLLEQMLEIGNRHGGVANLRIKRFDSSSRVGFGLAGRHLATLDVVIIYGAGGEDREFRFAVQDLDVGAVFVDDKSIIPFASYGHTDDEVFHKGAKRLIDAMLNAFDSDLRQVRHAEALSPPS